MPICLSLCPLCLSGASIPWGTKRDVSQKFKGEEVDKNPGSTNRYTKSCSRQKHARNMLFTRSWFQEWNFLSLLWTAYVFAATSVGE